MRSVQTDLISARNEANVFQNPNIGTPLPITDMHGVSMDRPIGQVLASVTIVCGEMSKQSCGSGWISQERDSSCIITSK